MPRFYLIAAFSFLLLSAGLAGGRGLRLGCERSTEQRPVLAGSSCLSGASASEDSSSVHDCCGISSEMTACQDETDALIAEDRDNEESESGLNSVLFCTEPPEETPGVMVSEANGHEPPAPLTPADVHRRKELMDLIVRMFPEADPGTAEIWAEAYDGMDLGEVQFILEQKLRVSTSLDSLVITPKDPVSFVSSLSGSLPEPLKSLTPADLSQPEASPVLVAAKLVRNNLSNAWSPGFRRMVVLPAARPVSSSDAKVSTVGKVSQPHPVTAFRSYDVGHIISSPVTTHLAIGSSDGAIMFCLEGHRFTRRGDFVVLPDRRIGLFAAEGTFALADGPQLPDDAGKVEITAQGEIQYQSASGELVSAGTIGFARIAELDQLQTSDGVIFFSPDGTLVSQLTAEETQLRIHSLESSNVSSDDEAALLRQLESR